VSDAPSDGKLRVSYALSISGGIILSLVLIFETLQVLSTIGQSIFQEIDLSSSRKIFISLYLFFGLSGATSTFLGEYLMWRDRTKAAILTNAMAVALAIATYFIPSIYKFSVPDILTIATAVSVCLISAGILLKLTAPKAKETAETAPPLLRSIEITTVAIFSALYAAFIILPLRIPSPTGGYTHFGDFVVFVAALLFGPNTGGLTGIMGAVLADLYAGYPQWYVSILAHGLEGVIPGLAKDKSVMLQVISCVIGGLLMASTYFIVNVFIKGFPLAIVSYMRDLIIQAGASVILGVLVANTIKEILPGLK